MQSAAMLRSGADERRRRRCSGGTSRSRGTQRCGKAAPMNLDQIAGIAHQPQGAPKGVVVLTHGAGGNRDSKLLQQVCDEWARCGWLAVRYNLPYRRRRPKGPPSGSATTDQAGVVEAVELGAALATRPGIAGGHSYGGRMTSMVGADGATRVDALTLF